MHLSHRLIPAVAALALVAALPGCAPRATGSTYSTGALGGASYVSYGTIVGTRPVQVAGDGAGVGTAAGAVAGGLAGSFIGGDVRSNVLAGLGGALIGGLAGNAIGSGVSGGNAIEFIVRQDEGGDIAVVQTNEEGLQAGDRVVISRGDRVRLARAAGPAPQAQGYAPPAYAPPAYTPQGYVPPGTGAQVNSYGAAPTGYSGIRK